MENKKILISDPNHVLDKKTELYFNWRSKNGHQYLICIDPIYKDLNYDANRILWIVYKNLYNTDDDPLKAWYLQPDGKYRDQNTLESKCLWDTYFHLSKQVESIDNSYKLIIFDIMN